MSMHQSPAASIDDLDVDVVVVGGGIAGLACAHRLRALGREVLVLESSDRVGGVMRSDEVDGFLVERGPNTSRPSPALRALVDEVGLVDEVLVGDPHAPAFVFFRGRLHPVPRGPGGLLTSRLLGAAGALRMLAEPFVPRRAAGDEESVATFARRRLGRRAAERLVAPFVSGIHAGDPEAIGIRAAFPALATLEAEHGSLVRGLVVRTWEARRARRAGFEAERRSPSPRGMLSFRRGLGVLPEALAERLREVVLTGATVGAVESRAGRQGEAALAVRYARSGREASVGCRALVIAAPAAEAARLLRPLSAELSGLLGEIRYAPLAIVHLALPLADLPRPLDGFGFLTTPAERPPILACLWSSSLFPGRAPAGQALLTTFVGGTLGPDLGDLAEGALVDRAAGAVRDALGARRRPHAVAITRWKRAIPQYDLAHADRVRRIDGHAAGIAGLRLVGGHLRGLGTADCIADAERVARELSRSLREDERPSTPVEPRQRRRFDLLEECR